MIAITDTNLEKRCVCVCVLKLSIRRDTFVQGRKRNVENASEGIRIVSAVLASH